MSRMKKALCSILVIIAIAGIAYLEVYENDAWQYHLGKGQQETPRVAMEASDGYRLTGEDMQLPELPTGCEATALSTLLRMTGVQVTKTEVADAMPKSGTDFVYSFLGDPYEETGGCCMAPCSAATARGFLGDGMEAYETEGCDLAELRLPCVVWVTIGLAEPQGPIKTQGAYSMYYPSHCVTVIDISGGMVKTIDPLKGFTDYPLEQFERVYEQVGAQAVYIGKD